MKRVVLGVLVLAVCGMMVAPIGMAGKPSGGGPAKKYSLMSGDFVDDPTVGEWRFQGTMWEVGWSGTLHPPGPGGPVTIWDSPAAISQQDNSGRNYISGETHGETLYLGGLKISNIPVGTYTVPGDKLINRIYFMVQMDHFVVGDNNNVLLSACMDTNKFHQGSNDQVTLQVTNNQVILYGNHVHFHYEDYRIVIVPDQPLYGHADHDFEIVIDK